MRDLRALAAAGGQPPGEFEGLPLRSEVLRTTDPNYEVVASLPERVAPFASPERVFGEPAVPSCLDWVTTNQLHLPGPQIVKVTNARIIGHDAVLGADSALFAGFSVVTDSLERALVRGRGNHDGFVLETGDSGPWVTYVSRREPQPIAANAVFFGNREPSNYGSFLVRQLPAMALLRDHCADADVYVAPDNTVWFHEALRHLGLPRKPVLPLKGVCGDEFTSVTFATDLDSEGFARPDLRVAVLEGLGLSHVEPTRQGLYVSRSLNSLMRPRYRVLVNERVVEAEARRRGIEIVQPETLGFPEQAKRFAQAPFVFGPSGSGMLNATFSRRDTRVLDLESFTDNVRQHAKVYASANCRYSFLFGSFVDDDGSLPVRRWTVDSDLLGEALDWLMTD